MEQETLVVTIRVHAVEVYTFTMKPVPNWGTCYFDIPPGVIPADYQQADIKIEKKGG